MFAALIAVAAWPQAARAAPRQIEALDRGVVAVKMKTGVYVGWRILGTDPRDIRFNLYRDGQLVNQQPARGGSNLIDQQGTIDSTYTVHPVLRDQEQPEGGRATVWPTQTLRIPLDRPAAGEEDGRAFSYSPNDISVGDLDGDGQWELVVKWDPSNSTDNTGGRTTGPVYLDAYELSGEKLWRVDLGRNIRAGPHYTPFLVGDYDGDGCAEMACKTAPGTIDGRGNPLSQGPAARDDDAADYRNKHGTILDGPEYLTIFNGRTGAEMDTVPYLPGRGKVESWGDNYGNRVDRFLATNAYLDGVKPSMVFQRGYYTRLTLAAYDWNGRSLSRRWFHDSPRKNEQCYGQGNHNVAAGDIDGDGRDEIVQGACAVDDDGTFMYRTGLGHGDAMHLGDLDPDNPGLEVWCVHESSEAEYGEELHDARTGRILWGTCTKSDNGRGVAADIDPRSRGHELWSASVRGVRSSAGEQLCERTPHLNFRIYWDADLEDEILDRQRLDKWIDHKGDKGHSRLITLPGMHCNGSKSTPNFSGDILGDWREEVILHGDDCLYLTTTTILTPHGTYTLAHDPVYRLAMSWQNSGYNQPPHLGFWLGGGIDNVPQPELRLVKPAAMHAPPGDVPKDAAAAR